MFTDIDVSTYYSRTDFDKSTNIARPEAEVTNMTFVSWLVTNVDLS